MRKSVIFVILFLLSLINLSAQTSPLAKEHSKFLGNIIPHYIPEKFDVYWNQVTPENAGKWGSVEGDRNRMRWGDLDRAYNHAKSNGYPFRFHTFVWGAQEPSWITSLSKEDQKKELEEFYKLVSERYPDIDYIDVVNEPLHQPSNIKDALGGGQSNWIIWAFEKAREYFPNAKLHINDYGIINSIENAEKYNNIIRALRRRNLIDGIGIQCHHFSMNLTPAGTIKEVLDILSTQNLPIYVTELDITGNPDWRDNTEYRQYIESNPKQDEQTQYLRYKEKFPILWEHESVAGITLWGYIEGRTWVTGSGLLNSDASERKAMAWLKEYMSSPESKVPNKFYEINSTKTYADNLRVSVYPNPASNYVSILGENINKIELYDVTGKLQPVTFNGSDMNISHLEKGLYLLKIEVGGKVVQQKLLKQ